MSALSALNGRPVPVTSATVAQSEPCEKKKYTIYKVLVTSHGKDWVVYRRYNEFHKLYEMLKKQIPGLHLKLPGKKLFGNNFDPLFIKSRIEGLDSFVQRLLTDQLLCHNPNVQEFFSLNNGKPLDDQSPEEETSDESLDPTLMDKDEKPVNLGPSEKLHAKPSDFEFLKVIGKGSYGKVLLAKHKVDECIYAVKVLQKKMILKRNEARHIMSERNVLLKNLHHPFLVGLHFSFQTVDKLYFVLDYLNGGELFFHLQRERCFPEPRAKFYAAEIASALGYLHSQGIVYRDLKPENILLDAEGHVVLTDFGLCKEGLVGTDTTSTFCGTPEYLAPEVLRKQPYDRSVDWWCLGVVLYEMLYGLPPFYSKDTPEMYDNILFKPLRLRSNMSLPAKSILEGLLEKNRELRLGSGEGDVRDIKNHTFFQTIDWDALVLKQIQPPYHPNLNGALDLKNIDPEFTKEAVPSSIGQSMQSNSGQDMNVFEGFSYVPADIMK